MDILLSSSSRFKDIPELLKRETRGSADGAVRRLRMQLDDVRLELALVLGVLQILPSVPGSGRLEGCMMCCRVFLSEADIFSSSLRSRKSSGLNCEAIALDWEQHGTPRLVS